MIVLVYIVHSYWKLPGQLNDLMLNLRLTSNFIWSSFVTISNKSVVVQWELREDEIEGGDCGGDKENKEFLSFESTKICAGSEILLEICLFLFGFFLLYGKRQRL